MCWLRHPASERDPRMRGGWLTKAIRLRSEGGSLIPQGRCVRTGHPESKGRWVSGGRYPVSLGGAGPSTRSPHLRRAMPKAP